MSAPFYSQVLASQRAAGTLFNTYTTAKSVLNATEIVPMPGNYLQVGSKLRVRAWGGLSNVTATPGTVVFQIMNALGTPIILWTSGLIQLSTTVHTLIPFELEVILRLDSAGSGTAAKFIGGGRINALHVQLGAGAADPTVSGDILSVPAVAPAVGTGFDSTIASILDFWVGWSSGVAGNGVQLYDYTVEQLQ